MLSKFLSPLESLDSAIFKIASQLNYSKIKVKKKSKAQFKQLKQAIWQANEDRIIAAMQEAKQNKNPNYSKRHYFSAAKGE